MKSCERSIIRINQLRIINSKLSPRRSGADVVANLKFIILGMTRVANSKIIIQIEGIIGNKADSVASLKFRDYEDKSVNKNLL